MKQLVRRIVLFTLVLSICAASVSTVYKAQAQLTVDPNFNPNILISDQSFSDTGTFGSAAGIQKFLEQRNSLLANTSQDFLLKLKEPTDSLTKVGLEDPQPNLGRLRTAAELIYDVSTKHGINPQVLLVTLEKEQGLITGRFADDALQRRLDRAFGFSCTVNEGCGDIFLSFYRQLFGTFDANGERWLGAAASLSRSFRTEGGRGPMVDQNNQVFGRPLIRVSKVGDTIVLDNTTEDYGVPHHQSVTLGNKATAALYRFTPHVFNGNYNFWKFFNQWFKYPNGTVIKLSADSALYVIDNSTKRPFSQIVANQRKINTANFVVVSQTEFDSYLTDKPLPPLDGSLIKGDASGAVYLVKDSKKSLISYPVFVQRKFSFANVITLPQAEIDSYEQGPFLAPANGTLIIGETVGTVYFVENGIKRPVSYEVFVARKFSFGQLMKLSDSEINSIPTGNFVYPPDQVAIKLKGDTGIFWFRDGQKRYISAFVYKQRGVSSFPHMELGSEEFNLIPTAAPFPPKDGTVIKGDSSTAIYLMENGFKRLLTLAAYQRMRNPKPTILPQAEVDAFASGDIISK